MVKWSRYRPAVAQRLCRSIALLFHDLGTRRGWVVSSTPRSHFTPGKDPVPILQEAGWAPGPVWSGGKSRPHRDSIPDRPARSQSLYRLSYSAHTLWYNYTISNDEIHWGLSLSTCMLCMNLTFILRKTLASRWPNCGSKHAAICSKDLTDFCVNGNYMLICNVKTSILIRKPTRLTNFSNLF